MSETMPKWAKAEKYEYDLGMSTSCDCCGTALKEGQMVWRDIERRSYRGEGDLEPTRLPMALYCSEKCVLEVEGPEGVQP